MDECGWNGTANEVKDSAGTYDATAMNGADTLDATVEGGGICRVGDMRGNYLKVESPLPTLGAAWSMSAWVKFPLAPSANQFSRRGYRYYVLATVSGRGDLGFFAVKQRRNRVRYKWGVYDNFGNLREIFISAISDGWHHVAQVVDSGKTYLYIDGSYVGNVSISTTGELLYIGSSTDSTNDETIGALMDEFKIFDTALSSADINSIYANEKAGLNYDGTARVCNNCSGGYAQKEVILNAVDYASSCSAVTDWDDNITTKIAAGSFNLSILAKDSATGLPMEANITKVDLLYYSGGDTTFCSGTPYRVTTICSGGCGVTDPAGCMTLNVSASANDRAAKCVQVHIEGKDINSTLLDVNESNSSDNFAIRPDSIRFLYPVADANLTAEENYYYAGGVKGVAADGATPAADYNTTLTMQSVKYMRSGEINSSLAGTLAVQPSLFRDGIADINFSFNDVAILSLRFNDARWSAVDRDDTPLAQRRVFGERNVTFKPSHFQVEFLSPPYIEDNDTANRFTYLSDDLNMSAWVRNLSVVVTAKGSGGGTMQNFSNPMDRLFADPVDISPLLSLPAKHSAPNALLVPEAQSGADINFSYGEAIVRYEDVPFNYDRPYDSPVSAFLLLGSEGNISVSVVDSTYRDVNGSTLSYFDGNATFYYGRIRTEDVATTELSTSKRAFFEVYDPGASSLVSGFTRTSLNWYLNIKHDSVSAGRITDLLVKEGTSLNSATDDDISAAAGDYIDGSVTLEINSSTAVSKSRTIHLGIDRWLWYAPKGFGLPYDFGASSDCLAHPCLFYTLTPKSLVAGAIVSGDFNGSDFNASTIDANATFKRKEGVKLFR